MSEVKGILDALDTILQADTDLENVKSFTIFEDEIDLATETRKFPFINLNAETEKTGQSANMPTQSYEQRTYMIIITFAVCEKTKSAAMIANWDLSEYIKAAYTSDRTIGGTVKSTSERSEMAVDALKYQDDNKWVGRGIMTFDVNVEEYIGL